MHKILYIGGNCLEGAALGLDFPDNRFKYEAISPRDALEKLQQEKYDAVLMSGPFGGAIDPENKEGLEARVRNNLNCSSMEEVLPTFMEHYGAAIEILDMLQNHPNNKALIYLVVDKLEVNGVELLELFRQMLPENPNLRTYHYKDGIFEVIVGDVKSDLEKAEELNTRI